MTINRTVIGTYARSVAAFAAAGLMLAQFGAPAKAPAVQNVLAEKAVTQSARPTASPPEASQAPAAAAQTAAPAPTAAALKAKAPAKTAEAESAAAQRKMLAFHALVYNAENLAALADFAADTLAPMGYNTVIVEIDDRFRFKSHPEISGGDVTAADARAFSKKVKAAGMDVIPLYECLGHQGGGGERNALLTAHPELDETPWVGEDAGLPDFYCPSWCASDDEVYDYVLPAIDELIDAFGAKTFHVGMDEVFEIGEDARCKGTPKSVLFANTVKRLHSHLAARGVKMMMWGDRLLDGGVVGHEWEADVVGTHNAINRIPRDILIADWHYERTSYPSAGIFLDHGFTVLPSVWKDPVAAENFLRSAGKQAAARGKPGKLGGAVVTDWSVMPVDLARVMSAPRATLKSGEKGLRDTIAEVAGAFSK